MQTPLTWFDPATRSFRQFWKSFIGKRCIRDIMSTTNALFVLSRFSKSFFISKFWVSKFFKFLISKLPSFVTIFCLLSFNGDCYSNNKYFVNKSYCCLYLLQNASLLLLLFLLLLSSSSLLLQYASIFELF